MVGECVTSSMVDVLLGYTGHVLQCWNIPQAKYKRDIRSMEKRESHTYMETFSPLRKHELTGMGLFSGLLFN